MSAYLPLTFIEEKVKSLENALFFSLSDAVLKIPTCVIKLLDTDELGQIWFMIPKPTQKIHAFEKTFPVKLDFFRKGHDFFVKIIGKAFLVHDPEEINSVECINENIKQQARNNEALLLRVQITRAEFVEKQTPKANAHTLLYQVKETIYRWFQQGKQGSVPYYERIPADIRYPSLSSFSN